MKTFYCKRCLATGTRKMIRKHIREDHFIKGKIKDITTGKYISPSPISREMGVSEE